MIYPQFIGDDYMYAAGVREGDIIDVEGFAVAAENGLIYNAPTKMVVTFLPQNRKNVRRARK